MSFKQTVKKTVLPMVDALLFLFIYPVGYVLKAVRKYVSSLPLCKRAFMQVGVFPIRDHYYEPLFDGRKLLRSLNQDRDLPGIDWNANEQLSILDHFSFNEELREIPKSKTGAADFFMENESFGSGDAEYFYNIIRFMKPSRIFEIGSGNSTLMARKAIKRNQGETPGYYCKHICVEPYEMPWLEKAGVTVVRQKVEEVGRAMFAELDKGDILFIDSSHVIRPQGDVLFEYLELLPTLKKGVIVHVHDIFSPKDYPEGWITNHVRLWNEQYLLEGFLTGNREWKIIGALNYLHHKFFERLQAKCPFLTKNREPGSFYIQKVA